MIHPKDKAHQQPPQLFLGIVDFDSPIYRCAAVWEDDTECGLESAKLELISFVQNNIVNKLRCDNYLFVVSGCNNFREVVAVTKPYKGNRKGDKPIHYLALRAFAITHFDCLISNNCEADDYVVNCHQRYQGSSVLVGIDKDNLQSSGWHYNYGKGIGFFVTPYEAQWSLAYQLLVGDSGDNIQGIKGTGDKTARKVLEDSKAPINTAIEYYKSKGLSFDFLVEQYRLLYMIRDEVLDFEHHFKVIDYVSPIEPIDDDEGDFVGVEVVL